MNANLKIIIAVIATALLLVLFLIYRKKRSDRIGNNIEDLLSKGDYTAVRKIYGRYTLILGIIGLLWLIVIIGLYASGNTAKSGAKAVSLMIIIVMTFRMLGIYKNIRKLELSQAKSPKAGMAEAEEGFWAEEDSDLFYEIGDKLMEKSNYLDDIDVLSDPELTLCILSKLDAEVNNGGFDQFFLNTDNRFDNVLVKCAETIGAIKLAKICAKAVEIESKRKNDEKTRDMLYAKCDTPYYDLGDELYRCGAAYARLHKDEIKID